MSNTPSNATAAVELQASDLPAHCPNPAVGVKVYNVVVVLLIAGDQDPIIPLRDGFGNGGIIAPEQYGPTAVNKGIVFAVIVTFAKAVTAGHPPDAGNVYVIV